MATETAPATSPTSSSSKTCAWAISGGINTVPTSDQIEQIGSLDILFVPVGGGSALEAPPAAEAVSLLEPKLVIPMHYKTTAERASLTPVDRFLKEMGAKISDTHAKVSIARSSLPEETQVMVLDYKRLGTCAMAHQSQQPRSTGQAPRISGTARTSELT